MGFLKDFLNNTATAVSGIPPKSAAEQARQRTNQQGTFSNNRGSVNPELNAYQGAVYPDYGLKKPAPPAESEKSFSTDDLKPRYFNNSGGAAGGLNYNVNMFTYPEKTAGEPDLQHYMVFFINARGASKYVKKFQSVPVTTNGENRLTASGQANAGAFGIGGGLLGAAAAKSVGAAKLATAVKSVTVAVAAIAGGVVGEFINESRGYFKPDQSRRINRAIMLAISNPPDAKYGITYEGSELGSFTGFLAGGSGAADNLADQQNTELAKLIGLTVANLPAGLADLFGGNLKLGDALQAGTAQAPNPFREQVFRNVQNREFMFKYKFLPRSETEARNVRQIIQEFKLNMHPELSSGGLFYVYPNTFSIAYYFNGYENTNLNKISTCVLEDLAVDYGGQGFNTFADGMPTEINLSLKFRELEVMTRERIERGF